MAQPSEAGLRVAVALLVFSGVAEAQTASPLVCRVKKKIDSERAYSQDDLNRFQFTVEVLPAGAKSKLRRCSYSPSAGHVTCDEYEADYEVRDMATGIRKLYYYRGQFDVQVFPNGTFVENNGRGSIAFGTCSSY